MQRDKNNKMLQFLVFSLSLNKEAPLREKPNNNDI